MSFERLTESSFNLDSSDTLPTHSGITAGTFAAETDTGSLYGYDGTSWLELLDEDSTLGNLSGVNISAVAEGQYLRYSSSAWRNHGPSLTIGVGAAGVDYTLTFDGETNDLVLTWMEDEAYLKSDQNFFFNTNKGVLFAATGNSISGSGSTMTLLAGTTIAATTGTFSFSESFSSGAVFSFPGTSNTGQFQWDESNDRFLTSDDWMVSGTENIFFNSTSNCVGAVDSNTLQIAAGTTLNLKVGAIIEAVYTANAITFNNGTNDTIIGWATDDQMDFTAGTFQFNKAGADIVVKFNTDTNDGQFTWDDSADQFLFADDVHINGTEAIFFNGADNKITGATTTSLWYYSGAVGHWWNISGAVELYMLPNVLYMNSGSADPSFNWSTDGNLDVDINSVTSASFDADGITIASGNWLTFVGIAGNPGSAVGQLWHNTTTKSIRAEDAMGDQGLVGVFYANTADSAAISNTVTETEFDTKFNVPADALTVGTVIDIYFAGELSTHSTAGNCTIQCKFGSVQLATTGAKSLSNSQSNKGWYFNVRLIVRSVGATGTVMATADFHNSRNGGPCDSPAVATIDTTAATDLRVTWTWTVANAANTVHVDNAIMRKAA